MMSRHSTFLVIFSFLCLGVHVHAAATRRSSASTLCQPFHSKFAAPDVSTPGLFSHPPFVPISPPGSYAVGNDGLELYMEKPSGPVHTSGGVNDVLAEGATVNSTFSLMYGRITMEVQAPQVAGAVTAAILIAAGNSHDEIDIELLGSDPSHWQTNVFTMSPQDSEPLYGVFGSVENYSKKAAVSNSHNYTIDWNAERIIWSVDGSNVRTLKKVDTRVEGIYHFPTHPLRVQLGIWDASSPIGTSEWAHGPIKWSSAPSRLTATFRSVTIECPN